MKYQVGPLNTEPCGSVYSNRSRHARGASDQTDNPLPLCRGLASVHVTSCARGISNQMPRLSLLLAWIGLHLRRIRVTCPVGILAWLVMICQSPATAQSSASIAVPSVGCAADGQQGPVPAPAISGTTRVLPASVAARLAYYGSEDMGVLAPRGWHCVVLSGSSGATLLVTPERFDASALLRRETTLTGPAIQLSLVIGGTSGRFGVAEVCALLFPTARSFVLGVIAEGLVSKDEFRFRPYRSDVLTRRSDTVVEYVTPANHHGVGTHSRMVRSNLPISGVAVLLPGEDMDLVKLDVRLPPEMRDMSSTIIRMLELDDGRTARPNGS
jgi:hypothetical protein